MSAWIGRSTPLNVNKQIFKKFPTYVKNIVQIHKWQMTTPDYLMIDLKSKGGAATPTRGDGRLIVYGITGTHNRCQLQRFGYTLCGGKWKNGHGN